MIQMEIDRGREKKHESINVLLPEHFWNKPSLKKDVPTHVCPCACSCSQKPHLRAGLCSSPRLEQQPVPPTAIPPPKRPHFEPPQKSTGDKAMCSLLGVWPLVEATHQQAQRRLTACRKPRFSGKNGLPKRHVLWPCLTLGQSSPLALQWAIPKP